MKRSLFLVIALAAVAAPNTVSGFQGISGGRGLYYVQDARPEGYGLLTLRGSAVYADVTNGSYRQHMANVPFGVNYSFTDFLEVVALPRAILAGNTGGSIIDDFGSAITDMRVGIKGCATTWLPVAKLGGTFFHQFPFRQFPNDLLFTQFKVNPYNELRGMLTIDVQQALRNVPFSLTANYGYTFGEGGSYTRNGPDAEWFFSGIGVDISTPSLQIYGELAAEDSMYNIPLLSKNPAVMKHIAFGGRIKLGGFGIGLDFDRGLTANLPVWSYSLGLSFSSAIGRPPPTPMGNIAGTVIDARTGAPLSASILLPDTKLKAYRNKPILVNDNGVFKIEKIPAGIYVLEVTRDGYQRTTATVVVKNDETTIQDFRLSSLIRYGTITGRVTNARTGAPIVARIKFPGTGLTEISTDQATGVFTQNNIETGVVVLEAGAEGYQTEAATVTVKDGEVTTQNFALRPLKLLGTITGRVTDARTGAPLAAVVRFPGTEISGVNADSANGVFVQRDASVGAVVVEVSAEGYQTEAATVTVKDGEITTRDFALRPIQAFGTITGRILDAATQKPLSAQLAFPVTSALPAVESDSSTGVFTAERVPAGTITVKVSAFGYLTESRPVVVEEGKVTNLDFLLRAAQEFGILSGIVSDATTGKPIKAQITAQGQNQSDVSTDDATGFYKIDRIPAGVAILRVTADGYQPTQATVEIEANRVTVQDFRLTAAIQNGLLTGVVTDMKTKKPLAAFIYFPGTELSSVVSDSVSGLYTATLPVKPVVVACSLPGYARQMSQTPVIITPDAPAVFNFPMLKIGTEITLSADAIHFAFNSAEIQPAGYPALDEWVKLLKDNPLMTAEIQGHTDAVGTAEYNQQLSERRAQSVVAYLTSKGISSTRLKAIGYGETRLVVHTQQANEANRRVVFKVTGEKQP